VEGVKGSTRWLLEEKGPHAVRLILSTDYEVRPRWLDRIAHHPFFRGIIEDLLGCYVPRFEKHLREEG
jgi:hypothetical protein